MISTRNWERALNARIKHEKNLMDQYVAYKKSNGRMKPKIVVGKRYRTRYPELYAITNPAANAKWKPCRDHVKSVEYVPKERDRSRD